MKAKFEIEALDSVWAMDLEEGSWEQMQSMGERRAKMAVVEKGKADLFALGSLPW